MINGTELGNQSGSMSSMDIIIAIGTIATAVILGVTLFLQIQDRKPKFVYQKLSENGFWIIQILHPDKRINKLSITLDGKSLPLRDATHHFESNLEVGSGQNFDVGRDISDESKVVISYDKNKIKIKFGDMPLYKFSLPK